MAWLDNVEQSTLDQMESAVYTLRHADDPLLVLRALAELRDVREQLELAAVRDARAREHSWAELAEALRRPRQAVHRKHRNVEQDENHAE
jgi:predicted transcriptional regulator